jgi:hypothetical protein
MSASGTESPQKTTHAVVAAPPSRAFVPASSPARMLHARWGLVPLAGLFATLPFVTRRVGDPDYWWHELTGQWIVQHHGLARADLYTYTVAGTPWTDQEYGSQLLLYALHRVGGLTLVSIVFALIVFAGFALSWARIRERDHAPLVTAAAFVLGAAAGFPVWGPRPQMFDFTFLALELLWIERFLKGGSRAVYWTPLLVLVWANLHGGFVFAFFGLGLTIAALLVRWVWTHRPSPQMAPIGRLLLVGAGSVFASLLTPWGPSLFLYVWRTEFQSQDFVREWQSPDFHMLDMWLFGAVLLAVLAGMAWRRPRIQDVFLVVAAAALSLHAWRFIPIFVAVATPVVAWQWSDAWRQARARASAQWQNPPKRRLESRLPLLVALVAAASVGIAALTLRGQTHATAENYPVAAADWLAEHPHTGTRMFNEYSWGGYLAYRFYPQADRKVFIYGESELMGETLLAQYADINGVRGDWSDLLQRFRVDYIVFPVGTPLVAALEVSAQWRRVYADSLAAIFVRAGSSSPP